MRPTMSHRAVVNLVGRMKNLLKEKTLTKRQAEQVLVILKQAYYMMAKDDSLAGRRREAKRIDKLVKERNAEALKTQKKKASR